jgi:hypothetical protein
MWLRYSNNEYIELLCKHFYSSETQGLLDWYIFVGKQRFTWRHISKDQNIYQHYCKKVKS